MDVRILGGLEAWEGETRLDLGLRKARQAFAVLCLQPGTPVRLAVLGEALWPDQLPASWERTLHSHVSRLRGALREVGADRIRTVGGAYALDLADDELDARRFERLATEGRDALTRGDHAGAAELLSRALAEWRGPVLADFADEAFVEAEARRLDEVRRGATEDHLAARLDSGTEVAGELETLVAEQPLRERGWELLIRALYRAGRQADALRRYQDVRELLADELGIAPGPGLQELERAILDHDPALMGALSRAPLARWLESSGDELFIGRDAEIDVARRAWEDARRGKRRIVVLEGEPGIGKTRLAREIVRRIDGAAVLGGRCDEVPLVAYQPIAEALGRVAAVDARAFAQRVGADAAAIVGLLPELERVIAPRTDSIDADAARYLLYRATSAAMATPVLGGIPVLVIDDLHWAAAPTLHLLAYVLRDDDRGGLLVIATARDTERSDAYDELVDNLVRERRIERLHLTGLSPDEVAQLGAVRGAERVTDELFELTEGNPFYVEELSRHVAESGGTLATVPDSVRDTIARRVLRLPAETRRLLGVAAVVGSQFELDVVAAVAELSVDAADDALRAAVDAGLAHERAERAGRYAFSHVLVQHALRDGLGRARRARVHRRIGEALERLHPVAEPRTRELAYHFLAAADDGSDPGPGVRYAERAAAIAISRFAYEDAARLYEAALRALDGAGEPADGDRVELLLGLAQASEAAGSRGAARTAAFEAVRIARRTGTREQFARAVVLTVTTRPDRSVAPLFEEALAGLEDTDDVVLKVEVLISLAWQLADSDVERARALAREAFPLALEHRATRAFRRILDCEFQFGGRTAAEKRALADRALTVARAAGDELAVLYSINHLAVGHLECGDLQAAWDLLPEQQAIADRYQLPVPHASLAQRRGGRALLEGRFDEALQHCSEVLRLCGDDPAFRPIAGAQLIAILSEQGRAREMLPALESERSMTRHPSADVTRAWMYAVDGRHADARAELAPLLTGGLGAFPDDLLWMFCMINLIRTAEILGDRPLAQEVCAVLRPHEHDPVVFGYGSVIIGVVGHFLGPIVAWLDDVDEGIAMLEHAIEVHRSWNARPLVARGEANLARLLAERGHEEDGPRIAALRISASAVAAALGMSGDVWTRVHGSFAAGDVEDSLLPGAQE